MTPFVKPECNSPKWADRIAEKQEVPSFTEVEISHSAKKEILSFKDLIELSKNEQSKEG